MNVFRIVGDSAHVLAIFILFAKFFSKSSSSGISGRSQFLFALTYIFRYLDVLTNWVSYYNTVMKVFFVLTTTVSMLIVIWILRRDYEKKYDTFWVELLIVPVTFLAFLLHHEYSIIEVCWTWSIYMEAFALIPQFYMTWRGGRVDAYLVMYILALMIYRGSYLGNWVHRYYNEDYYDIIAVISGIVETLIASLGLLFTILKYNEASDTGYAAGSSKINPSVYTLPFITNVQNKGFFGGKGGSHDKVGLLSGPYNPDLSIPILQYEEKNEPTEST